MPVWTGTVLDTTPARSPLYTVRYTPPGEPLWFSAAITYIGIGTLAPFSGNPGGPFNLSPARLRLLNDAGVQVTPPVNDVAQDLEADGETSVILRGQYGLTSTQRLRCEVQGVLDEQPNFWQPIEPLVRLEWVMIHLGPEASIPPTLNSHGSALLTAGLVALNGYGPDTGDVFECDGKDLSLDPEYNASHERIEIGAYARQYEPDLGIDRQGRVIGVRWDPVLPKQPKWIIDTRPREFTRALARQ
jgi:hypothetical protein